MKKLHSRLSYTPMLIIVMLLCNSETFAQDTILKTAVHLAPGVTHPLGSNTTTSGPNPQMITSCDGNDIRIFPSPNPQSEIHLSINRTNPNVLLLSSNTFPVANSWQGAYWSTNGGANWAGSDNLPNNAPGRGDPSTAFDAAGNGYVSTMSYPVGNINGDPNGYAVQRTANNGAAWQPQVSGSGIINGFDKPMIAADDIAASPNANNFYCAWTNFNVNGRIQFNRSTNLGVTFSAPIFLSAGSGQGANVQTGTNGEVYVCWSDYAANGLHDFSAKGLGFCRSVNGGVSFTSGQRVLNYTGIRAYNAATNDDENPLFNNIRVNDFPSMSVDKSNGAHRGRLYVVVPVKENGNGKAVIQISWSDNQGTTWSSLKTISIANGRQNWFPWISVDASNGNLYVIYYSLDAANGFSTNTYVAISNDGGATFINQLVSDVAHTTAPIPEFGGGYSGDYIGITSFNGRAYAAWCDNRTGQWQDYVSQVSNADIIGSDNFCTSSSYSLTNIPANSVVTWSVSPAGIANLSCTNCNQTTLTRISDGTVTLIATIANACGTTSLVLNKSIAVGGNIPALTGTYSTATNTLPMQTVNFVPSGNIYAQYQWPGITNISAALAPGSPPGTGFYSFPNGFSFNISSGQNISVNITGTNSCGRQTTATRTFIQSGGYSIVASPNPATSNVNVSITEVEDTSATASSKTQVTSNTNGITKMYLYDFYTGGIVKQWTFNEVKSNNYNLNIVGVKSGVYVLKMERDNKATSTKIIVQ